MDKSDEIIQHFKRRELIDFDKIVDFQTVIYLPPKTNINKKINIIAAIKAYNQGYSSIDYVKKKFEKHWRRQLEEENSDGEFRKYISISLNEVTRIGRSLEEINVQGTVGYITSRASLWRLQSSFKSALILIRHSYFYESIAILRLILEQISWVYSIYNLDDQDRLMKVKPTKTIDKIKIIFPQAGKLYGYLSKYAHLSSEIVSEYLKVSDEYADITIKGNNGEMALYILLLLVDLYATVCELIFFDLLQEIHYVYLSNEQDSLIIDETRHFYTHVINQYVKCFLK